jgi:hypothetical protein
MQGSTFGTKRVEALFGFFVVLLEQSKNHLN